MTPLEEQIARAFGLERFACAARSALSGQAGSDLIAALLSVAHPMYPPEGRTPEDVAREIGRREVVSLLIRQTEIRPSHHDQREPRHWTSASTTQGQASAPEACTGSGTAITTDPPDIPAGTDVDSVSPADAGD